MDFYRSKLRTNFSRTVDHGFVENVHSFLAVACEEDGDAQAQEVMKFDKAVKEDDGHEDPDKDPASHHLARAVRWSLHENQSGDKPVALRVGGG